jgi:hypothetical protein
MDQPRSRSRGSDDSKDRHRHHRHRHHRHRHHPRDEDRPSSSHKSHHRSRSHHSRAGSPGRARLDRLPHDAPFLEEDDYYERAREFRAWLASTRRPKFGDMSGEEAREHFREFVSQWNSGGIPDEYYLGKIDMDASDGSRTGFQWGFASRLPEAERMSLEAARDTVAVETDQASALKEAMEEHKERMAKKQARREEWERKYGGERDDADAAASMRPEAAPAAPSADRLMAQLGLQPGQVVTIRPRED